jgi:hypothetical protein
MSQAPRPRSEFLGLHDPYREPDPKLDAVPRHKPGPLLDRDQKAELVRAGGVLTALFILIGVAITAFS